MGNVVKQMTEAKCIRDGCINTFVKLGNNKHCSEECSKETLRLKKAKYLRDHYKPRVRDIDRNCRVCNKHFFAKANRMMFCSSQCCDTFWQEVKKKKRIADALAKEEVRVKKTGVKIHHCEICNRKIVDCNSTRFCSKKCQNKNTQINRTKRNRAEKAGVSVDEIYIYEIGEFFDFCAWCDENMFFDGNMNRTYCNDRCSQKHRDMKKKDLLEGNNFAA